RMMHRAAKEVVGAHGSKFPACADELRQLPGIGRYTAAAVASIAFNQKSAVVDGNVARVMERMMGVSLPEKAVWQLMEDAICLERPGDFNQAMMELGASVCTPKNPLCGECPVKSWCVTRGERPAALKVVRRSASLHYLYATSGKSVQLVQRSANDSLMAGMWELPSAVASSTEPLFTLKHSITNTDYQVFVFRGASRGRAGGKTVDFGDVEKLPLTGLTRKILKRMGAIANPV
ncbi:MAG TPA: hypothetical protein VM056_04975, partial [Terriglobales bacterium]|nr:hypothetical protein [Terriglobales bacterium]